MRPDASTWRTKPGNWDPLNTLRLFDGEPLFGIPYVPGILSEESPPESFAPWPARKHRDPQAGLHFFVDDYRFEPLWRAPNRYATVLCSAPMVLAPDFSVYADWPLAAQVWNVYRSRWTTMAISELGATVIPSVSWGDYRSFGFAFLGIPRGCTVAITTVGRTANAKGYDDGFHAMVEALSPTRVIAVGSTLPESLLRLAPIDFFESDHLANVRRRQLDTRQLKLKW